MSSEHNRRKKKKKVSPSKTAREIKKLEEQERKEYLRIINDAIRAESKHIEVLEREIKALEVGKKDLAQYSVKDLPQVDQKIADKEKLIEGHKKVLEGLKEKLPAPLFTKIWRAIKGEKQVEAEKQEAEALQQTAEAVRILAEHPEQLKELTAEEIKEYIAARETAKEQRAEVREEISEIAEKPPVALLEEIEKGPTVAVPEGTVGVFEEAGIDFREKELGLELEEEE